MFQLVAAMAEFELSLTRERVRAGLSNARKNGKTLGRPYRVVDFESISRLKGEGQSLRTIAETLKIGYGTVRMRLAASELKTPRPRAAATVGV